MRRPLAPTQRYARAIQRLAKARRQAARKGATADDQATLAVAEAACAQARRVAHYGEAGRAWPPEGFGRV